MKMDKYDMPKFNFKGHSTDFLSVFGCKFILLNMTVSISVAIILIYTKESWLEKRTPVWIGTYQGLYR